MKTKIISLKLTFLALVFLTFSSHVALGGEKLTLGIKVNTGFSKSTENVMDNSGSLLINAGGQLNYYILPFLGLESGLQFTRSGYSYDMLLTDETGASLGNYSFIFKYDYMIVPAYLRLKVHNFYGTAGLNFAFNTGSSGRTTAEEIPDGFIDDELARQNINKRNYDLHLGVGYQKMFLKRAGFFLELGFNHQLTDLYETAGNIEPKLWNLNIGGGLCVSLVNN